MSNDEPPRARARRHLDGLKRGAALLVTAAVGPANAGCDVAPAFPPGAVPQVACAPANDVNLWIQITATRAATISVDISLSFNITGTRLADTFTATGGTVTGRTFDGASLATSTNVEVEIVPDPDAEVVVLHTGLTCGDTPRAITIDVRPTALSDVPIALQAQDVTP